MDKKLLWRVALILVVIVISVVALYPPAKKIHLGLDLKGGIHLVLRVNTDDAIKAELDDAGQRLLSQAKEKGITLGAVTTDPAHLTFTVEVPPGTDTTALRDVAQSYLPEFKVNPGAGKWTFQLPANVARNV
ncbi:MAG TPA: hypothetical protein ENK19_08910, partial [Acidobacteria bacterium]|nr:hypothetical protein [Acidobacteriota bacterium]